ncbi:hypothetical protein CSB11_00520 [Candidatus Campbellbacteria bacterium]|nr:MAG: hypothetical protein CSB11_00520 [Candidatus Campbellbacteria bacterium]
MNKIIFDIETRNIFADVGSDNPADLDISVLSLYDYKTDKYYSFLQEDFDKMWPFFENADVLITFNGKHFDLPLLQKYAPFDLSRIKHLDIFQKVQESIGRKIGLDTIANQTLGEAKSANGLQAVAWWNEGKVDEIIKYCEKDVEVTKNVYEYAKENKILYFEDRNTKAKTEIKLNPETWEDRENSENDLFGSAGNNEPLTLF